MKKIFVCIFVFICLSISIFADGYYVGKGMSGKRLAIHEPEFKNINSNDSVYLYDLVFVLRTYFHDYAGFDMVDVQNQEKIQKLQAKSESSKYDDKTTLTAGKLQFAEYEAFVTVSKAGSAYSLSLNITDLTTMKIIASSIVKNINKVTDIDSVGVRNLMLDIIPKVGVQLTAIGKYSLSGNKSDNLTIEQELSFAKQEEKALQDSLNKLNTDLKNFSKADTDMDTVANKAQLEVEKQLAEKRLAMAQEKTARLIEQKEKEEKEKIKASERSQEVNKRITSLSNDVENVAAELRNKKFNNLSYSEQILIIEKNKKAYIELRNKIEEEIKALYTDANREYQELKIDVDDITQYRKAELSNGVPTESAKSIRIENNLETYNSIMNVAKKNEEEIRSKALLSEILKDIQDKQVSLSKPQIINSLEEDSLLSVGEYDGTLKSWPCYIKVKKDGEVLLTDNFLINFNNLSKALGGTTYSQEEMDGKSNYKKYTSYLDDVETYDSLFRMGTPLVNLAVELIVKPLPKNDPSGYSINISKYTLKATTTNKVIIKKETNVSNEFYSKPIYDLRTTEEIKQYQDNQQKKLDREQNKSIAASNNNKWGLFLGGNFGSESSFATIIEVPLPREHFLGFDLNFSDESFKTDFRLGYVNYLPYFKDWCYPALFWGIGAGVSLYNNSGSFYANYLVEMGIDINLFEKVTRMTFQMKYQLMYDNYMHFTNRFFIGLSIPPGVFAPWTL